jgi:hypothetical protein
LTLLTNNAVRRLFHSCNRKTKYEIVDFSSCLSFSAARRRHRRSNNFYLRCFLINIYRVGVVFAVVGGVASSARNTPCCGGSIKSYPVIAFNPHIGLSNVAFKQPDDNATTYGGGARATARA